MPRETFDLISTTTTTASVADIVFSSIPSNFTDLVVVTRHTHATLVTQSFVCQINGDTNTNYSWTYLYDNGTQSLGGRLTNVAYFATSWFVTPGTTEGTVSVIHFNDYSNTATYKAFVSRTSGLSSNSNYTGVELATGTWRNTAAISSLRFFHGSGSIGAGSTISVYGVRAE